MGSIFEWITVAKAAEALQVSERQVYTYIRKGQLTVRKEGNKTFVNRQDVKSLIDCRTRKIPRAVNALTVARMDADIKVLQKQVDTLMRLMDIRYEPLGLEQQELVNLHDMAIYHSKSPWSPYEEEMWCDVFVKLRIEDLEQIASVADYHDVWRPFLTLAKAMFETPRNKDNKLILSAGKTNIEKIAFIFAQKIDGTEAREINKMVRKDEVLVRRLTGKMTRLQQKFGPSEE